MNKALLVFCIFALTACFAGADNYDIVILNGRVMDPETEFDAVRNVAIKDGVIVAIRRGGLPRARTRR